MFSCRPAAIEANTTPLIFDHPTWPETDTFNLLVPHSECKGSVDLYKEYASVRGPKIAIPKDQLHQIKVPANTQPCNVMGIHPKLPILKELYDDGDAAMVANMGALVEVCTSARKLEVVSAKPKCELLGQIVDSCHVSNKSVIPPPQPVTRDEFLKKKKRLPPGLFAVRARR